MILNLTELSPSEAQEILRRMNERGKRTMVCGADMEIKGSCEAVCRDAITGEVAWQLAQENTVTDYARQCWFEDSMPSSSIFVAASTETPDFRRYSICTPVDGIASTSSGGITSTNTTATLTKTWSTTFGTPSSTRTIGTIGLGSTDGNSRMGIWGIRAYLLLSPPKTQTVNQTLEIVYKLSMSPIA